MMLVRIWKSFLTVVLLTLLLFPAMTQAQDAESQRLECARLLRQAEADYQIGRFQQAYDVLEVCLLREKPRPSRTARRDFLALQAKILIAQDLLPEARTKVAELLRTAPDYSIGPLDPLLFRRLIEEVRELYGEVQISSVSKSPEALREAPATVEVLDSATIERRGYLDLEQLLHDLPGFNISRGNGTAYSNIYQRGFRANSTERTLLLIDGVEHNDLFSNIAWISRQYPITAIDRVEIVYGPASTMYGANAYTGVINVITKTVHRLLEAKKTGDTMAGLSETTAVDVRLGVGARNTRFVDAIAAGRVLEGNITWSLIGRIYRSDEQDLSAYDSWDYDADAFDFGEEAYERFGDDADKARALDRAIVGRSVGGQPLGFSDLTDDWYLSGSLGIQNLEFGFQTWRRREGSTPWYEETARPGAENGFVFVPEQIVLYLRYARDITENLSLSIFTRYKEHSTDPETSTFSLRSYGNGTLDTDDLAAGTTAFFQQTRLIRTSDQLRSEMTLGYTPSQRLNVVAGVEVRFGTIQVTNFEETDEEGGVPEVPRNVQAEKSDIRDLGAFVQASYRFSERWKVVLGGRLDDNDISPSGGFGTVFNSRLAAIYSVGNFTGKAIYGEAFKDATNFNRFSTIAGTRDLDNPFLRPEEVDSVELSGSWRFRSQDSVRRDQKIELSIFQADYSDVISTATVDFNGTTTTQFQNLFSFQIRGAQLATHWEIGRFDIFGNYTFTKPTDVLDGNRVGDIAEHQVNAGLAVTWRAFTLDTRLNWVGDRETGENTTVDSQSIHVVDGYALVHATLTWKNLLRGIDLQLVGRNLFDEDYADPGVRTAGGGTFASTIPQPGRSAFLRATLRF